MFPFCLYLQKHSSWGAALWYCIHCLQMQDLDVVCLRFNRGYYCVDWNQVGKFNPSISHNFFLSSLNSCSCQKNTDASNILLQVSHILFRNPKQTLADLLSTQLYHPRDRTNQMQRLPKTIWHLKKKTETLPHAITIYFHLQPFIGSPFC